MPQVASWTVPTTRRVWYTINYPWLADGETIISASTVVAADSGADDEVTPLFTVSDTEIDSTNKRVLILAGGNSTGEGGGLDQTRYLLYVSILTSTAQESTDVIEFNIDDEGL